MKIGIVAANLVTLRKDLFTTGIVYMPIGLVYLATRLAQSQNVHVIDSFGEAPQRLRLFDDFVLTGLSAWEVSERIAPDTDILFLYADRLTHHLSLVEFIRVLKRRYSRIPLVLFENTQAVTAYSIKVLGNEFFDLGIDYLIFGEPEERAVQLVDCLSKGQSPSDVDGLSFMQHGVQHCLDKAGEAGSLDKLPFPDWSMIPLDNYWRLRYAHGPFETDKYLPILTSRGCPYPCNFCVIPATNDRRWRGRSPNNVVDEMEWNCKRFGVREFHVEDVNPTVSDDRIRKICQEIISRKLEVIWKLVSGTKVETIKNEETIALMGQAGCRYISISPESGSARVMKMINKSFDFKHALRMIKAMKSEKIISQACFALGYPGEKQEDLALTRKAVWQMAKAGVDEITLPIITPVPGSNIYKNFNGFENYSQLNFSPTWRNDFAMLNTFRLKLYGQFFLWKLRYYPLKMLKHPIRFLKRQFKTKLEMTPFRALQIKWTLLKYLKIKGNKPIDIKEAKVVNEGQVH